MKWPDDFVNKIICGDCLEVMGEMPEGSIDMCMTSPPYWGLRDYGNEQIFGGGYEEVAVSSFGSIPEGKVKIKCEHKWEGESVTKEFHQTGAYGRGNPKTTYHKSVSTTGFCLKCNAWKGQLGLEPTPELYIEHMTAVFHEVKRVLKKEGTLWLNIGDTYAGAGGQWSKQEEVHKGNESEQLISTSWRQDGLQPKCLCMIPERLAWSLIQDGWILRNKILWYKPNGMPSSVKDRFSNKHEFIYMFSQQQKYYFDLDAVREPHKEDSIKRACRAKHHKGKPYAVQSERDYIGYENMESNLDSGNLRDCSPGGKNPGDVFEIEDGILKGNLAYKINQFEEAHPEMDVGWFSDLMGDIIQSKLEPSDFWQISTQPFPEAHFAVFPEKLCEKPIKAGCPEWGTVLDPFCGAGTTLYVAKQLRRKYIGIDVKQEYCGMSEKRLAQGVL